MLNETRLKETFLQLVQIDSVSGQEAKLAGFLKQELQKLGLEVWEDQAGQILNTSCGNLLARLPGTKPGQPLLLAAHMDTVEPGQNIKPCLESGRIKSDGRTVLGSDDKAGVAIMLEIARSLTEKKQPHVTLELAFTVCEEIGLLGARHLDLDKLQARQGYTLDHGQPIGELVIAAPFYQRFAAVIKGRSAHAGLNPEDGINAIAVAAQAISRMKLGRLDSETTANIGIISGGKATNIIPDSVLIEGEVRSLDQLKFKQKLQEMLDILQNTVKENQAELQLNLKSANSGFSLNPNCPVCQLARQAAESLQIKFQPVKSNGGCDANILNGLGLEMANLAVGMQEVHTTQEWIAQAEPIAAAKLAAK
ncbi:MAG: M20/M25/M40 family metallo-hydrolase, partial [Clostridia bacterium]|nr:M20/M25/M40 family metallo-hydrolase [Clostridia bacterium]